MHTELVVRRPLRILGRDYAPGEALDDPKIPLHTLSALLNRRKIGQRVGRGDRLERADVPGLLMAGDPRNPIPEPPVPPNPVPNPVPPTEPLPQPADTPQPETPPQPAEAPVTAEADDGEADTGLEATAAVWRAAWAEDSLDGETFRQYLMRCCASVKLSQGGAVPDLLNRLARHGIRPAGEADADD